jgi:hypothetical protein
MLSSGGGGRRRRREKRMLLMVLMGVAEGERRSYGGRVVEGIFPPRTGELR